MDANGRAVPLSIRRPLTTTERNWLMGLALVVGSILLATAIQAVEIAGGRTVRGDRLIGNPVEASMRFFAMPHFLLAILFMTTSRGTRNAKAWTSMVALTALGVGLCFLFAQAGGRAAYLPNALFLGYFLVHEFRDQAFFYRVNGDVPPSPDAKAQRRDLLMVPVLGLLAIMAVFFFGAAFRIGGTRRYTESVYGSLDPTIRGVIGSLALLGLIAAIHMTRRSWDRRHEGGALGFLTRNRPIFVVFGGIMAVLILDIIINGRAYAIVTLHVATWYVFVMHGYSKRPAPDPTPKRFSWPWMRSTKNGFNALHTVLVVGIVLLAVLWAYGSRNSPDQASLWVLLSKDAFPYWTIMHVTISFTPRT